MQLHNTSARYGALSMGLHWLTLILILAVYATIEFKGIYPKGSAPREAMKALHFMLGLSVFVLVWLRLAARLSAPLPVIEPAPPKKQQLMAELAHLALYAFMIGMPIMGWLTLSAAGKPIPFFGLQLPALIDENKEMAGLFKEIHEAGGTAGYLLIGLHAAAALFHHHVMRDNTLLRMLPRRN